MKKFFIFGGILLSCFSLWSAGIPFRSGIILAAELSKRPQKIQDFDEAAFPDLPRDNKIYAAVTLTVFNGRVLSRFDYSLSAFGKDYKCVAIKTADGPWKSDSGDIEFPKEGQKYAMLFILDSRVVGLDDKEKLAVKCNYPPKNIAETDVIFTNRKEKNFTPARQISSKGILKVTP